MSCRTENIIIGQDTYSCTQYPASLGLVFKLQVVKIIGPVLETLVPLIPKSLAAAGSAEEETLIDEETIQAFTTCLGKVFSVSNPQEVADLIMSMITSGSIARNGIIINRAIFEQSFSGDDLLTLYKVFFFVLRVNYASLIPRPPKKEKSPVVGRQE